MEPPLARGGKALPRASVITSQPYAYLRDLLCLLPSWPINKMLELAPANWRVTLERPEVQQRLEANVFRQVAIGTRVPAAEKVVDLRPLADSARWHDPRARPDVARRTGTSARLQV